MLRALEFENDYGVDIGLLLDAAAAGARLHEVDIGYIDHQSQALESLGNMAKQVLRTLLDRANRKGRLRMSQIRASEEFERRHNAQLAVVLQRVGPASRLALFDMDGTLLRGRFAVALAERTNRQGVLARYLDNTDLTYEERTRQIAALFAGVPKGLFEEIARKMPLMPGAVETVVELRKAGYRVGIVSDSFQTAAEIVRRRVFADFCVAHDLKFRQEKATGQLILATAFAHPRGCPEHASCKLNVMQHLLGECNLQPERVLAVGDSDSDRCMLRAAGRSIAFRPKTPGVGAEADFIVTGTLLEILGLLGSNRGACA